MFERKTETRDPLPGFLGSLQKRELSKKDRILNHLHVIGNISQAESTELFGDRRLAAVIHKLKIAGNFIISILEMSAEANYSRYFFPEAMTEMEIKELYKCVCYEYEHYPEGEHKEKIKAQKEELERRYPGEINNGKN